MQENQGQDLQALTTEELAGMNLELDQIWYLKAPGSEDKYGPFTEAMLKAHFQANPDFDSEYLACNEAAEEWSKVFDIPVFQRRKPQLAQIPKTEVNNQYHILFKGQKLGPFPHQDIVEKLKTKELLYNDFVSTDKGYNWFKIFELPDFDRRDTLSIVLPVSPSEETFGKTQMRSLSEIEKNQGELDMTAMIASSARRKVEEYNHVAPTESISVVPFKHKKKIVAAISLAMTCTLAWVIFSKSPNKNTSEADEMITDQPMANSFNPNVNMNGGMRSPASNKMFNMHRQPRSLNQISREHNVPVPINDAQNTVNYDDPPAEYHEMSEATETTVSNTPNPNPGYPAGNESQPAESVEPEGERIPASADAQMEGGENLENPAPAPDIAKKAEEAEIFNQEVEN
jgi:hypothetical protein